MPLLEYFGVTIDWAPEWAPLANSGLETLSALRGVFSVAHAGDGSRERMISNSAAG